MPHSCRHPLVSVLHFLEALSALSASLVDFDRPKSFRSVGRSVERDMEVESPVTPWDQGWDPVACGGRERGRMVISGEDGDLRTLPLDIVRTVALYD